jgi:hypothetical protein
VCRRAVPKAFDQGRGMHQDRNLYVLPRVRRKEEKTMSTFNEVLEEASLRVEINQLRRELTVKEARIVVKYLRNLIGARPKPESRAHMATLELEGDPK